MQARFYLPMWGRFASPDPARDQHFEETQSWNIYSYVRNNPVQNIDPTGEIVLFANPAAFEKYYKATISALPKAEQKHFTYTNGPNGQSFISYNMPMQKTGENAPVSSQEMQRMMDVVDSSVVFKFDGGTPTSGATGEVKQPCGDGGKELPSDNRPVGVQDIKMKDLGVSDSEKVKMGSDVVTAGQAKTKVIAHELLGHGYLYISGQSYQHTNKGGRPEADRDIKAIEDKALKNSERK